MILINILLLALFIAVSFTVIYSFIFSVGGIFASKKHFKQGELFKKIAVLIPASREDKSIVKNAQHALFQQYPSHRYDVIVVANELTSEVLDPLKKLPIKVIETTSRETSVVKSLQAAFQQLKDRYDIAVIMEANHTMRPYFLEKVNSAFVNGCYAVQGRRVSNNSNTPFSILSNIGDEINNHIFRKGQQVLGLSSMISGSGIAFSYQYFKQVIDEMEPSDGFDKELELKLITDNHRIVYLDDACIVDEKDQLTAAADGHRTQWISSQLAYLKKYFMRGMLSFFFGKFDYANKIANYALVPKVLLVSLLFFATTLSFFGSPEMIVGFTGWLTLSLIYIGALLIAIPFRFYRLSTLKAMVSLPYGFTLLFKAFFSLNRGKKYLSTVAPANFSNVISEK